MRSITPHFQCALLLLVATVQGCGGQNSGGDYPPGVPAAATANSEPGSAEAESGEPNSNSNGSIESLNAGDNASNSGSNSLTTDIPNQNLSIAGSHNTLPTIAGIPEPQVEVGSVYTFTPIAKDSDNDTLSFAIRNLPHWANFDSKTGTLHGEPVFSEIALYKDITITVSDGLAKTSLPAFSINVTMDEVELALLTGDASVVQNAALLEDAVVAAIDDGASAHQNAVIEIFNLDERGNARSDGSSLTSLEWDPTHDAGLFSGTWGENSNLLVTNSVIASGYDVQKRPLAIVGEAESRYIVFGSNPMRNYYRDAHSLNDQMHRLLENSLMWLTRRHDLKTTPSNIVLAQLSQNYYFPDEVAVREWLDEHLQGQASYNEQNTCDAHALAGCLDKEIDLLIISQHQNEDGVELLVKKAVSKAMENGVPVLYMHVDGNIDSLGEHLLPLFDVNHTGDNYWRKLGLSQFDITDQLGLLPANINAVRRMTSNFQNQSFGIDWDACDKENCKDNASLNNEFINGASYVRAQMRGLDQNKIDIFDVKNKYRFAKLLALLGDHYRMNTSFPIDKKRSSGVDFLRALYADYSAYQYRKLVGVWSDMGNFGRVDYSHITPQTRTVKHISKKHFKSTGAYALPGQTTRVTRKDTSDVELSVFVNSLRDGSTHLYAENGYTRPHLLSTTKIALAPGETIYFTSHIGGPIHLAYSANDLPVEVVFENVGEHPYWRDATDTSDFESALLANEFDWAEIAAPSFEVHSTREKMVESMANPMFGAEGGTPQKLVDATMRYVHNYPHVLAGFQGPGVDVVDEIHQFALDKGLSVANLDLVKHMNADQATCGYGCSGNPYDAYWSFSPIGHGDIHELGHGLERSRFKFSGWPGHTITNFYSYYTKSQYFKNTGNDPDCQSLPFEQTYSVLLKSLSEPDPAAYVQSNLWDNVSWSQGATMIIQMMMAAQDQGALIDGWHLLARMHIVEREYQAALKNDSVWTEKRGAIGMDHYDRLDAKSMSPEDWLLIVVSHSTGFDFRAYFDVWAHGYTEQAAAQVAAMGLASMPLNYYLSSGDGFCRGQGFDGTKAPLVVAGPTAPIP